MTDTTAETSLVIDRLLEAPPEKVWRCLTEPELLRRWFAPHPVEITDIALDLTPGGMFGITMEVPGHGTINEPPGCVLLVVPLRRLVWTSALGPGFVPRRFGSGPMEFPMTADMTLSAEGDGTRYVATALHAMPEDTGKHAAMGFHAGWGTTAKQLNALAQTL